MQHVKNGTAAAQSRREVALENIKDHITKKHTGNEKKVGIESHEKEMETLKNRIR